MSAGFDPYHRWLSIPPDEQPPDHYRLLGIEQFESTPDVIETAADRQTAYVRTFQSGEHAESAKRILSEIAEARLVLLRPDDKAAYDKQLRGGLRKKRKLATAVPLEDPARTNVAGEMPIFDAPLPPTTAGLPAVLAPRPVIPSGRPKKFPVVILIGGVVAAFVGIMAAGSVAMAVFLSMSRQTTDSGEHAPPPPPVTPAPPAVPSANDGNATVAPPPINQLEEGLLAYWSFDEGQGNVARDSQAGHHGEVRGATWIAGVRGGALRFDGKDDVVFVGNPNELNFNGNITIAAWVRPRNLSPHGGDGQTFGDIVAHGFDQAMTREVFLRVRRAARATYQTGAWARDANHVDIPAPPEDLNRWVHLVSVHQDGVWRLYRDGKLAAAQANSNGALRVPASWGIGAHPSGNKRGFEGDIDEVRIFSRALSQQEVAELAGQ